MSDANLVYSAKTRMRKAGFSVDQMRWPGFNQNSYKRVQANTVTHCVIGSSQPSWVAS